MLKKGALFSLFTFVHTIILLSPLFGVQEQGLDEFVASLKRLMESKDIPAYVQSFVPEAQALEGARIRSMFQNYGMDSVSVYIASLQPRNDREAYVYLRLFFQNPTSVKLDIWRLSLKRLDGQWAILKNDPVGELKTLYKIKIPAQKIEHVSFFEVRHEDIVLTFEDAICFYDNIPDYETALIIVGKGKLLFSPSIPREQHQLELVFKEKFLEDKLDYAYLRFSNSFFQKNVQIIPALNEQKTISNSEAHRAGSLFQKHYSRSFTINNSLTGELLSVLPQGDEAVFEFKGRKVGDVTYVYSPFSDNEINFYQWKEERILNLYSPPEVAGEKRLFISFGQKYDILDYEIDLDFKPAQRFFSGKAVIKVESKVGQLDSLKLKINPALEVLRISDENQQALYYTEDRLRKTIYIYFLRLPTRGQTHTISVYYRGKIDPPALMSDVVSIPQYERTHVFGQLRLETLLYSHSALWYPAPDDVDYFTAKLKIITPPRFHVISNGNLVQRYELKGLEDVKELEDVEKAGNIVHMFSVEKPVKYLSFVVGRLSKREEDLGDIPIVYYRGSQTMPLNWDIFSATKDILGFFENLFGAFPYEKLFIIRRSWVTSGGHSPASFIVLNEMPELLRQNLRPSPESPVNLSRWKEYFLAHEIAHQWWGQGMAWDTYRDQWLSEGLAQFAAIMYLKHKYGDKAFSWILEKFSGGTQKKSNWGEITMGSRISYLDFNAYQTIVYNKSALVLNMLKDLLGDDVFYAGLKRFFNRHRYRSGHTDAFYQAFSDLSELNLVQFFSLWFDSHLLPEVNVAYKVLGNQNGYQINLRVVQTGSEFMFPLWVEWKESGKNMREKVNVDKQTLTHIIQTKEKPKKITINPDKAVPGKFSIRKD